MTRYSIILLRDPVASHHLMAFSKCGLRYLKKRPRSADLTVVCHTRVTIGSHVLAKHTAMDRTPSPCGPLASLQGIYGLGDSNCAMRRTILSSPSPSRTSPNAALLLLAEFG